MNMFAEPRPARLFQTANMFMNAVAIVVLEQPSPRRMKRQALGRRNIALLQGSELNLQPDTMVKF